MSCKVVISVLLMNLSFKCIRSDAYFVVVCSYFSHTGFFAKQPQYSKADFLTYETELVLVLVVLENAVLPVRAKTAYTGR